jgi:hypothetical protein
MTPEQEELAKLRRDLEEQEAFKADPHPWKRRYVKLPTGRIDETDPRERD